MDLQRGPPHVFSLCLNFPKARHHVIILLLLLLLIHFSFILSRLCTDYHSFRLSPLLDFVIFWRCLVDMGRCRLALEAHLVVRVVSILVKIHEVLLLVPAEEELVSMDLADSRSESF